MFAETPQVDAVIGGDTHRDSHALEMAAPNGGTIGTLAIGNDETGYADAIAWITENRPAPGWSSGWRAPAATASG